MKMGIELWTKSEEFAMKKNNAVECKLKDELECLSMENKVKKDDISDEIRLLKSSLKNIRSSTGYSLQDVHSNPAHIVSAVSDLASVSYKIPSKMKNLSHYTLTGLARQDPVFQEVDSALRNKNNSVHLPKIKLRALTTDGGISKVPTTLDPRKVKSETGRLASSFSGATFSRENTASYNDSDIDSSVFYEDDDENEEDEKTKKDKQLRRLYNPWNIQIRGGKRYDALELPPIKDCYRPLCRPNCSTCLLRKKKGPCFLVPGLVEVKDSYKLRERTKPRKHKSKSKHSDNHKKIEHTEDQTNNKENLEEILKMKRKEAKAVSLARINELATPRGGFHRPMRFCKASLKRKMTELKDRNAHQQLGEKEKENQRVIESKVRTFLAFVNMQTNESIPEKMVHIPLRDDLIGNDAMQSNNVFVHGSSSSSIELPVIKAARRKAVNFK